jgi:hypothetical protein
MRGPTVADATCVICGATCPPAARGSKPRRYCSERCRNRRPRNYTEATVKRRQEYEQRRQRPAKTCPICHQQYQPTLARQKYCSRRCGGVAHRESGQLQRKWPASKLSYCNCVECGRVFIGRGVRKSCGDECAGRRSRRRDLVRYGKTPEQVDACRACGELKPLGRKLCDPCRDTADREAKRRAKRRRKARQRGAKCEPYTLAYIAKRDHYRCGLCGKRVAMARPVPHPKAPTIDHIVPLDDGGDDVKANVQLAHFICNSVKGNRGGGEQLLLVG